MLEVVTKSGAIIHVDESNESHMRMLTVAAAAFGGIAAQVLHTVDEATA